MEFSFTIDDLKAYIETQFLCRVAKEFGTSHREYIYRKN